MFPSDHDVWFPVNLVKPIKYIRISKAIKRMIPPNLNMVPSVGEQGSVIIIYPVLVGHYPGPLYGGFEVGVPLNHPFVNGIFHEMNHPSMGVPPFM